MSQPSNEQIEQTMKQNELQKAISQPAKKQKPKASDDQLIKFEQIKANLKKTLSGIAYKREKNNEGEYVTRKYQVQEHPLCNEQCVEELMATVEGVVNKNTVGSYFSKRDIENVGRNCMYAIIDKIREKHEKYDIESVADATQIVSIIDANLKSAIKKAAGGRYLKHKERSEEVRRVSVDKDDDSSRLKGLL